MWTGRQTLSSIENVIANLHKEEGQLDTALRSAVAETERLRKERGEALRELARIKLDEMAAGRLVSSLDAGERRAVQILDDYRLRIAATAERREGLLKEVAAAEMQRNAAAAAVEEALAAVEAVRADTEAKVQAASAWQGAKHAFEEAEAVASEAEKKAAGSEAELGAKRKPYDDDPLFTYLWSRKFGTRDYQGGNFARLMDRIVADFIGFNDVRANYAALIEIPLRLREHATARRTEAGERRAVLSDVERRAMVEAGIEPKERTLAEARHKLAAADQTLEEKHGLLRKIEEERKTLVAGGSNPAYSLALETISSADAKDDLAQLYGEARRTPTSADDAIVRRLETIDANVSKTDAEVGKLRRSAQALAQRRLEVQQVRDRFRGAGYDHPHATFGNDGDIADVLGRVLAGAVNSGVLWDLLRGGYRYRGPRGRPDFGAPNFPFPFPIPGGGTNSSSGGGWREPSSRGGWSPREDYPDRSGGDDDNFTTGGSF
jgi:regulator of replication initiation timing